MDSVSSKDDVAASRSRLADFLVFLAIAMATVLHMLPRIASAWFVNSDIAIADLQAMHMLHGEWSPFLWSNVYQGCIFPLLAACDFVLFGPNEPFLFAVSFIAYIGMQACLFAMLRRHVSRPIALLLCLPTSFVAPIFALSMFYPRFLTLLIAMASLMLVDGASSKARPLVWLAAGTALFSFGIYVDEFVLFFLPGLGILGLLSAFDPPSTPLDRWKRLAAFGAPLLAGCAVMLYVRTIFHATGTIGDATEATRAFNTNLMLNQCIPYMLGTRWFDEGVLRGVQPIGALLAVLWLAAAAYGGAYMWGVAQIGNAALPWPARRLAMCALAVGVFGVVAFVISHVAIDAKSCRYLAPILLTSPLALAPAAASLRRRWTALLVAPFLAATMLGGAIDQSYGAGTFQTLGHMRSVNAGEEKLAAFLEGNGVKYAVSDYWVAYRVTFLSREHVVILPMIEILNYYAPYTKGFQDAARIAYVCPEQHGFESLRATIEHNALAGLPYKRTDHVGGYTVYVYDRR